MSMDREYVELMHAEIDGANDENQSKRLRRHLAEDGAARAEFDRLSKLAGVLGRVETVPPPEGLREDILAAIRPARAGRQSGSKAWLDGLFADRASVLRLGYAFAAGIVLGAAGLWLAGGTALPVSVETGEVSATIGAADDTGRAYELSFEGARGRARLHPTLDGMSIEVELASDDTLEVALQYGSEAFDVRGFEQRLGSVGEFRVGQSGITWSQTGSNRVEVLLRAEEAGGAVRLTVYRDGKAVQNIEFPAPNAG